MDVAFTEEFVQAPGVYLVPFLSDSGTFTASAATRSGFTLTAAGSDVQSQDLRVTFIAHEKF
jgi:hypothetical protein